MVFSVHLSIQCINKHSETIINAIMSLLVCGGRVLEMRTDEQTIENSALYQIRQIPRKHNKF